MSITNAPHSSINTTIRKSLHLFIDGRFAWGVIELPNAGTMGRSGWGHFRVIVYPPGTNQAERRAMTFARRWPCLGIVVGLLAAIAASSDWGFVLGTTLYLAVLLMSRRITRRERRQTRQVHVSIAAGGSAREVYGDANLFVQTTEALADLDHRILAGELTPVQYEAGWAEIYNALEPRTIRSADRVARRLARPESARTPRRER